MPKHLATVLLLLALLLMPLESLARDMTGKGGVGVLVTTEALPMLAFRYWRTNFALELLAGYRSVSLAPQPAQPRPEQIDVLFALGLLYRVADGARASLALGLRPWLRYTLQSVHDQSSWRFGTEIPLQAEAFLTDHFSLIGAVGLTIDFGAPIVRSTTTGTSLDGPTDTGVLLGVRGGFSGGLGATYYF